MKREVLMSVQAGQFYVLIKDMPRWVLVNQWVWDRLCVLTRGWLGGHGLPDVFWKIPVGRARWDNDDPEEPFLINSVASLMSDLEQWVLTLGDDPRVRDRTVAEVPVSVEDARKISPEFVEIFEDESEELNVQS